MDSRSSIFFDAHFHAMSISHPNFIAFLHEIESNFTEEVVSGMFSPNYLLGHKGSNALIARIQNLLTVIERSIGEIFMLMEDDLSAEFTINPPWSLLQKHDTSVHEPFVRNQEFSFRSRRYQKIGLCPMIMDFSQKDEIKHGVYHYRYTEDKLIQYVEDTLTGIRQYRTHRPDGIFSFYPFLGINPAAHTLSFIRDFFETYLISDKKSRTVANPDFSATQKFCYGVKLYPPLGFNPWPIDDEVEMKKVRFIYQLCESEQIPITTHCDDQGFRTISTKSAWEYSAPRTWSKVLDEYPDLIIDFAHYGKQYRPVANIATKANINLRMTSKILPQVVDTWFSQIIQLMLKYNYVFSDFSFSGSHPSFYKQLHDCIVTYPKEEQDKILSRSMFGTDFFVNLSKVDSYSHFYHVFDQSPFSDDQIHQFSSENILSFLRLT